MRKRTFAPPSTLGMNRSQGLKQSLLRPFSSRNKHSHNGTPSVHEEENVSYVAGEKCTLSVNMHNDSDFNVGVNEDDHLTPLQPQGSTDKSDKFKGKEFELDRDATLRHMKRMWHYWRENLVQHYIKHARSYEKALEKVPTNMLQEDRKWLLDERFFNEDLLGGKEEKMPTLAEIFKETRQLKSGALDEESASKLEEIIQTSKDNPHFSAFELVEECFGPQDCDHVAYFRYGMKPNDVRGPLPTRAALQAMLREKEKENIALHKRIDDMENAHKNDMDKLEDQVRMLANLVMANQQTSTKFGANTGSDEDDNDHQEKRNSS
ncbi:hypothetical protein Cgig2_024109 [Carnegiea gigantea]|uniref:Uncharacterized protein n=1 Tax=Carnegiea gigantea TaxID=171969 RepID=A0A9Q1JP37_9CARY|nr:hypothetical protein Cgig2_024109 [Carnegiea gigantea]